MKTTIKNYSDMSKEDLQFIFDAMMKGNNNNAYVIFTDGVIGFTTFKPAKPYNNGFFVTFFDVQFWLNNYDNINNSDLHPGTMGCEDSAPC